MNVTVRGHAFVVNQPINYIIRLLLLEYYTLRLEK